MTLKKTRTWIVLSEEKRKALRKILAQRKAWLAKQRARKVRKGIVETLNDAGYWMDETTAIARNPKKYRVESIIELELPVDIGSNSKEKIDIYIAVGNTATSFVNFSLNVIYKMLGSGRDCWLMVANGSKNEYKIFDRQDILGLIATKKVYNATSSSKGIIKLQGEDMIGAVPLDAIHEFVASAY